VLCILPFETEFYARHGVAAEYVGHPLVDELAPLLAAPPAVVPESVALLPGSRRHEVESLLPTMVAAVRRVAAVRPGLRARLILAPGLEPDLIARHLGDERSTVEVVVADRHRALASCAAALVASGTATLECALLSVPMVVGYRLHALSYALARLLVKVPHVALANLVAGRRVAPELVQDELDATVVAERLSELLGPGGAVQRAGLAEVRRRLGEPGASARAAAAVRAVAGVRT
jgi:lipid-A-disaccharide synthase